jgi:outer membrane protein assembly factor BamB
MRCTILILLVGAVGLCNAADPQKEKRDALWAAVRSGDGKAIAAAIDAGADVNARNEYGVSALWIAASKGKTEVIELLLARGADPNARDDIWYVTPLAYSLDKIDNVRALLKAGARDIDAAVLASSSARNLAVLQLLLESKKTSQDALDAALFAVFALKPDATKPDAKASEAKTDDANRKASIEEIRDALVKAGAKPLPVLPEPDRDALKSLGGSYENENGTVLRIEVAETGLVSVVGGMRQPYRQTAPNTFVPVGVERSSFSFERSGDAVKRLVSRRYTAETAYYPLGAKAAPKAPASPKEIATGKAVAPANWPQFRGIDASGVADGQDPPVTWDVKTGANVLWKTPIPGLGHSCPVIWGDRVFLTTAVGGNTELKTGNYGDPSSVDDNARLAFQVLCLDRLTGKVLWTRTAHEGVPKIKRHLKGSHANCTPATDGKRLVACFGAEGLYCYDFEGKLLWKRDLGALDSSFTLDVQYEWGFSASPVLFEDRVILQGDLSKDSFLAAYRLTDGSLLWSTPRDEIPSWSSPTIWRNKQRVEIVTNASQYARGYDPITGAELWRLDKRSEATVPTPVVTPELAFVVSGNRPIQPLFAVKPGARGDISLKPGETSNAGVAWGKLRGGPYMPTPIVYEQCLYTIGNAGMVTCYEGATGVEVYKERVGGTSYTASPVAADGRLYFTSEQGEVRVVKTGPVLELLAVNKLDETCMATPAICGGALYVRTKEGLVAVGRK